MNQHPFWDFVNEAYRNGPAGQRERGQHNEQPNWQEMFGAGFPFGPVPHRGRPAPPPPPPAGAQPPPPQPPPGAEHPAPPARPSTPPTPPEELPHYPGHEQRRRSRTASPPPPPPMGEEPHHHGRRGPHSRRQERHERRAARGRHHHDFEGGPPPPPPPFFGRGRCGRRGRGGPAFPIHEYLNQIPWLASQIPYYANQIPGLVNQYWPAETSAAAAAAGNDAREPPTGDGSFVPEVDVFSAPEAYVIHAAVPGAKKSDIDVSYDAHKNSVSISGVVQRPGEVDEVMLETLIEGDRNVGLFQRTIYLDVDVKVDSEGLTAKLEDGVLRIELPKEKEDEWTEVKKVHVE